MEKHGVGGEKIAQYRNRFEVEFRVLFRLRELIFAPYNIIRSPANEAERPHSLSSKMIKRVFRLQGNVQRSSHRHRPERCEFTLRPVDQATTVKTRTMLMQLILSVRKRLRSSV